MLKELKPESLKQQSWALLKITKKKNLEADVSDAASRPKDELDHQAIAALDPENLKAKDEWPRSFKDEFRYYARVKASESCLDCHRVHNNSPNLQVDDVLGIVKITYPLAKINKDLSWNNAVLLATAIITTAMAWLATYIIVRYVIVKPVLHLKEVSDSITRGDLEQRADIRTGDEFEELSQAFNRMLRHLTTVAGRLAKAKSRIRTQGRRTGPSNLRLFELNNLKNEFPGDDES